MTLRCKTRCTNVEQTKDADGKVISESLTFQAVYSDDPNSENRQWSLWTPSYHMSMTVNNPNCFGKVVIGQEYYQDIIPVLPVTDLGTDDVGSPS